MSKCFLSARCGLIRPEKKFERPRGEDGALASRRFVEEEGGFTKSVCLSVPFGYVSYSVAKVVVQMHPGRHLQ